MEEIIIAIDQSTTSTKAKLFSLEEEVLFEYSKPHEQFYPSKNWIEHDPQEILLNTRKSIFMLLSFAYDSKLINADSTVLLGIANQRETLVVWSRSKGIPLYNAIVWNDSRTEEICSREIEKLKGNLDFFKSKNGLPITTYFSLFKLMWLLENVETVKTAYDNNDLMVGTIDSWLLFNLSVEKNHWTDVTNASRTFLMNLKTLKYDPEILNHFNIHPSILPEIKSNLHNFGTINLPELYNSQLNLNSELNIEEKGLLARNSDLIIKDFPKVCKIVFMIGDQQSAVLGLQIFQDQMKITYGTGCFLMKNTGNEILIKNGLISTVALYLGDQEKCFYGIEAAIEVGGSTINYLKDTLGIISDFKTSDTNLLNEVTDKEEFFFQNEKFKGFSFIFILLLRSRICLSFFLIFVNIYKNIICLIIQVIH